MNPYAFTQIPLAFACDTLKTSLLKHLPLLGICCPLCLIAVGPNPDRSHLLFHGLFALLKGPVTPRQSASGLFNSCDRCHNRPIQPNEQMCVIWLRFCSCVCSYSMCDVYTARRKKETEGQTQDLLWKQWLFGHYLTQLLWQPCKCLASPSHYSG